MKSKINQIVKTKKNINTFIATQVILHNLQEMPSYDKKGMPMRKHSSGIYIFDEQKIRHCLTVYQRNLILM